MGVITLDRAIEIAMQLSFEQQEMLLEIIRKRHVEARRDEIAQDAQASLAAFRAGQLKARSADEVIEELGQALAEVE